MKKLINFQNNKEKRNKNKTESSHKISINFYNHKKNVKKSKIRYFQILYKNKNKQTNQNGKMKYKNYFMRMEEIMDGETLLITKNLSNKITIKIIDRKHIL